MEKISLLDLDNIIKEIFDEKLVRVVDTTYEQRDDVLTLIVSLHELEMEDTVIIHTKFIFYVDDDKKYLNDNKFSYLKNLGCGYEYIEFEDIDDLRVKLNNILESNDFDTELIEISEFISITPETMLNEHFYNRDIEFMTVTQFSYNPRKAITPCSKTTYDFVILVNETYEIEVSIKRNDVKAEKSTFDITYRFEDVNTIEYYCSARS